MVPGNQPKKGTLKNTHTQLYALVSLKRHSREGETPGAIALNMEVHGCPLEKSCEPPERFHLCWSGFGCRWGLGVQEFGFTDPT